MTLKEVKRSITGMDEFEAMRVVGAIRAARRVQLPEYVKGKRSTTPKAPRTTTVAATRKSQPKVDKTLQALLELAAQRGMTLVKKN